MTNEDSMDLKHSDTLDSVGDTYLPNSKSTDLIKPSKLDNQQPSGEREKKSFEWKLWNEEGENCLSLRPLRRLGKRHSRDASFESFGKLLFKVFAELSNCNETIRGRWVGFVSCQVLGNWNLETSGTAWRSHFLSLEEFELFPWVNTENPKIPPHTNALGGDILKENSPNCFGI